MQKRLPRTLPQRPRRQLCRNDSDDPQSLVQLLDFFDMQVQLTVKLMDITCSMTALLLLFQLTEEGCNSRSSHLYRTVSTTGRTNAISDYLPFWTPFEAKIV